MKNILKMLFGGDFQSGVYAGGGSLKAHGIKVGDTFLTTISGNIQKVKDKNGKIVYVDLSNGKRETQTPLPFDEGGEVKYYINKDGIKVRSKVEPEKKLTEAEWMAKYNDSKEARTYGFGGLFSKSGMMSRPKPIDLNQQQVRLKSGEYVQVLNQQGDTLMVMNLSKLGTGTAPKYVKLSDVDMTSFANGGGVASNDYDVIVKLPNGLTTKKDFEGFSKKEVIEWCEIRGWKYNSRAEKEGGYILKDYEFFVKRPRLVSVSLPNSKRKMANGGGVGLIGNQKRIDMNKNGKIDAEDFKLLRSSMNGAWRNERKHVNHNEDYEVRYARKKPSRTGYKGKRKFGEGGGISTAERFKKVVAKNREGNRVKPTSQKMSSGAEVKKGNKGGVMVLAKKIRKEGESWKDALKRAGQQLK